MIFRGIFFIALVSLLIPREPDLGLGRPGAGTSLPFVANLRAIAGFSDPQPACEGSCAGGLGAPPRTLADVKAEIAASIRARRGKPFSL